MSVKVPRGFSYDVGFGWGLEGIFDVFQAGLSLTLLPRVENGGFCIGFINEGVV
jgi:hypothetical protein